MKSKQYQPKTHFCPDCNREFHWLGWPRHRAMHRDKRLAAIVPTTQDKRDKQEIKRRQRETPKHNANCSGPLYPGGFFDC